MKFNFYFMGFNSSKISPEMFILKNNPPKMIKFNIF